VVWNLSTKFLGRLGETLFQLFVLVTLFAGEKQDVRFDLALKQLASRLVKNTFSSVASWFFLLNNLNWRHLLRKFIDQRQRVGTDPLFDRGFVKGLVEIVATLVKLKIFLIINHKMRNFVSFCLFEQNKTVGGDFVLFVDVLVGRYAEFYAVNLGGNFGEYLGLVTFLVLKSRSYLYWFVSCFEENK